MTFWQSVTPGKTKGEAIIILMSFNYSSPRTTRQTDRPVLTHRHTDYVVHSFVCGLSDQPFFFFCTVQPKEFTIIIRYHEHDFCLKTKKLNFVLFNKCLTNNPILLDPSTLDYTERNRKLLNEGRWMWTVRFLTWNCSIHAHNGKRDVKRCLTLSWQRIIKVQRKKCTKLKWKVILFA